VLAIALGCVGCDQATKRLAAEHLPREHAVSLAHDLVRLQLVENRGAFLGLGDGLSGGLRRLLLVYGVGACLAALGVALVGGRSRSRGALIAGSVILGGGLGNLLDRVTRAGHVVDFVSCGFGPVRTGIFNLADVAILAGVFVLVWRSRARPESVAIPADVR